MTTDQQTPGLTLRANTSITIDDVRQAVEEIAGGDPRDTNSTAIRNHLGRGGSNTIQKILILLREERAREEMPLVPEDGPKPMPAEVDQHFLTMKAAIWDAVSAMSEKHVRGRMDSLTAERDIWRGRAEGAETDMLAATEEIDRQESDIRMLEEAMQKAASEAEAEKAALEAVLAEKDGEIEALRNQAATLVSGHLAQVKEMEHAAETAGLKWEVERQTIRSLNEDLNAKLRDAETERDKILARIKEIQTDADQRVRAIEVEAKEALATAQAEAQRVLESLQARHNDEMTRAQDQAAKERNRLERDINSAKLHLDGSHKEAEALREEVAALKSKVADLEKATAPKREKKA